MQRSTMWLVGSMFGVFVAASWASSVGLGVPRPEKKALSVREDSARGQRTWRRGHHGTRFFFIGGGLHGGK